MSDKFQMRFTGSGGQGVILASVIFAEAAVVKGLHAVQSQAYGPEARGGSSKAECIISHGEIWFSKVIRPDFLLALTQNALDKYAPELAGDAVVMIDDSLDAPACLDPERVVSVPILRSAKEDVGKAITANIVAVGAINELFGLFDEDVLREAVSRHIPKGTEELNFRALSVGKGLIAPELRDKYLEENEI
ncbi:MAG: 2-oxoacid:acceptor oxidoreductase family protein [Oscillospiraceae bacterium]|nr:2-oxoacid:acceptor oxidoreductase family protein [Oscillospiraceae bacterium]